MIRAKSFDTDPLTLSIPVIAAFIFLAIIRLTNFNFILSNLVGFETEINELGGNAFNFINYAGAALTGIVLFSKVTSIRTRWISLWPFFILFIIYSANALFAPYSNTTWFFYQLIFLATAFILHIYAQNCTLDYSGRLRKSLGLVYWLLVVWVVFALFQILSQHSLSYFLTEYNDAFVQSLDDYGIMKQRFGYLLGFLLSFSFFISKSRLAPLVVLLVLFTGFGIRSFIIGLTGATLVFSLRNPIRLGVILVLSIFFYFLFLQPYFDNLVFDTRFYSFLNAFHIIQTFPLGVGLGGYPVYTEIFHSQLYANFYNVNALLDFVPTAPESDIVHILGSLGVGLGLVHLFIQGRIVWFSFVKKNRLRSFEKCILFYFCFMTFYGISEDSMFSINYWIFFGLSSGIIANVLKRK